MPRTTIQALKEGVGWLGKEVQDSRAQLTLACDKHPQTTLRTTPLGWVRGQREGARGRDPEVVKLYPVREWVLGAKELFQETLLNAECHTEAERQLGIGL